MAGQEFVDFIKFLPEELFEEIVCRLMDDETWTNCRLVCNNWDARISSNSHLWEVACQKLGLNLRKTPEVDYKSIYLKMRKRFQRMKNGSEFADVENITVPDYPEVMYYHNGIIAIGSEDLIQIWELEPNLKNVSRLNIEDRSGVDCIRFDDSYLVVWTNRRSHLITYKMPTMEKLYTKRPPQSEFKCVTFNTNIDLLVTSSKNIVKFWCLSSGTLHFTQTIDGFCIGLLDLISTPGLQNGCDFMLFCSDLHTCYKFNFDSQQIAAYNNMYPSVLHKFHEPHSINGSYFANPFLYILYTNLEPLTSTLAKCDPVSGKFEDTLINCHNYGWVDLVAVGRKYAVLLQNIYDTKTLKYIIYDLAKASEFSSLTIPCASRLVHTYPNCLGYPSWLDEFDGFNDQGVLWITELVQEGLLYVFKWSK